MSFKVTYKYLESVLSDENVVGFMADVFPNKFVRDQVFDNIMDCIDTDYQRFFIHYGYGANGKTTFCNLVNTIFKDSKNVKCINELNIRDLIIAKKQYPVIFITCNSIDDITEIFEGDEWSNTTVIPHTAVFSKNEQKYGLEKDFVKWITPYVEKHTSDDNEASSSD